MEIFFSKFKQYNDYKFQDGLQPQELINLLLQHGQQNKLSNYVISRILFQLFSGSTTQHDSLQILYKQLSKFQGKHKHKALQLMVQQILSELNLDFDIYQVEACLVLTFYHYLSTRILLSSLKMLDAKILDKYFKPDLFLFNDSQKQRIFDILLQQESQISNQLIQLSNKQYDAQISQNGNQISWQSSIQQYWEMLQNVILPFTFTLQQQNQQIYSQIQESLNSLTKSSHFYSYQDETKEITSALLQFFNLSSVQWQKLITEATQSLNQYVQDDEQDSQILSINQQYTMQSQDKQEMGSIMSNTNLQTDLDDSFDQNTVFNNSSLAFKQLIPLSDQQLSDAVINLNIMLTLLQKFNQTPKIIQSFNFGELQQQILIIRCLISHPNSLLILMFYQVTQYCLSEAQFIDTYQKNKKQSLGLNNYILNSQIIILVQQYLKKGQITLVHGLAIPATEALNEYLYNLLADCNDGWTVILQYFSQISLQKSSIVQLYKIAIITIKIFQSLYKQLCVDVFNNLQLNPSNQNSDELKQLFNTLKSDKIDQYMLDDEYNYYVIFRLFMLQKLHLLFDSTLYQVKSSFVFTQHDEKSILFNTRCMEYIQHFVSIVQNQCHQSNIQLAQYESSSFIQKDRILANIIFAIEEFRGMQQADLIFYEDNSLSQTTKKYQQQMREIDIYIQKKNKKRNDIETGICIWLQQYQMETASHIYNQEEFDLDDSILKVFKIKELTIDIQYQMIQVLLGILTKDSIFDPRVTVNKLLSIDQQFNQFSNQCNNHDNVIDAMQVIIDILKANQLLPFIQIIANSRHKLIRLYGVSSYVLNSKFITQLYELLQNNQNMYTQFDDEKIIQLYIKNKIQNQIIQDNQQLLMSAQEEEVQESNVQSQNLQSMQSDSLQSKYITQNQQLGVSDLVRGFQNQQHDKNLVLSKNNESSQSEDISLLISSEPKEERQSNKISSSISLGNLQHISQRIINSFNNQLRQYSKVQKINSSQNMVVITLSRSKKPFINSYIDKQNIFVNVSYNSQYEERKNMISIGSNNYFQLTEDETHQVQESEIKNRGKDQISAPLRQQANQLSINENSSDSFFMNNLQNTIQYVKHHNKNNCNNMKSWKEILNQYQNNKMCYICQQEITHECSDNCQQLKHNQFCFYFGRWFCSNCVGQFKFSKSFIPHRLSQQKFTVSNTGLQQIERYWNTYIIDNTLLLQFHELDQIKVLLERHMQIIAILINLLNHSGDCNTLFVKQLKQKYGIYQTLPKDSYLLQNVQSLIFNQLVIQNDDVCQQYNQQLQGLKGILKQNQQLYFVFSNINITNQGSCIDKAQYDMATLCLHILQCKQCQKQQFKCSKCGQMIFKQVKIENIVNVQLSRLCQNCQKLTRQSLK